MSRRKSSAASALIGLACASASVLLCQQPGPSGASSPAEQMAASRTALAEQCPPVAPRISDAEAAKFPIHVTHWGSRGPRVLLIHGGIQGGLGGGPTTFAKQEALAQQGWQVDLVDRPGFGRSASRGVDDQESDSVWIADMLDKQTNLIGHSWGGNEALLAAARRPQQILSLILVEPALQSLLVEDDTAMFDPAVRASLGRTRGFLMTAKTPQEYGLDFAGSLGTGSGSSTNDVATNLQANPKQAPSMGCALLQGRAASLPTLHEAIDKIVAAGIPILVISGGWSPSYDALSELTARLMHGKHVIVKSPNHFVQNSNPEEFNRVVDEFMRQADQSRKAIDPEQNTSTPIH
jgi:pimeloyl-ACP methyl ester carboxylesterase